jgi:hypothetical protein
MDHHAAGSNFQFVIDQTLNALDPSPTFSHTTLPPLKGTTPHPDGICTDGIFCGTPLSSGGNRNLADFESMTVDPAGNLEVIIPADCNTCAGNTENWFYKQTAGPQMPPGPTNGNGTGNQTWVAGARTAPPPQPPAAVASPVLPNTAVSRLPTLRLASRAQDWAALVLLALLLVVAASLAGQRITSRRN